MTATLEIPVPARKKPTQSAATPSEVARKPNRAPRYIVSLRKDYQDLVTQLAKRNRRAASAEIEIAIDNHLRAAGIKPPDPV